MDTIKSIISVAKWRGNFNAEDFWMYLCARAVITSVIGAIVVIGLSLTSLTSLQICASALGLVCLFLFVLAWAFSVISECR